MSLSIEHEISLLRSGETFEFLLDDTNRPRPDIISLDEIAEALDEIKSHYQEYGKRNSARDSEMLRKIIKNSQWLLGELDKDSTESNLDEFSGAGGTIEVSDDIQKDAKGSFLKVCYGKTWYKYYASDDILQTTLKMGGHGSGGKAAAYLKKYASSWEKVEDTSRFKDALRSFSKIEIRSNADDDPQTDPITGLTDGDEIKLTKKILVNVNRKNVLLSPGESYGVNYKDGHLGLYGNPPIPEGEVGYVDARELKGKFKR